MTCALPVACLLLLILCCWVQPAVSAPFAQEPVQTLQQSTFVFANQSTPPPDSADWQPTALPDWWNKSKASTDGIGWYRLQFAVPTVKNELYAVYLPKLGLNADVFLNGKPLGSGGSFAEPIARHWNRPLLFVIPPGVLQAGNNTLHVRLRGHYYTQPYLFPPVVGFEHHLRKVYDRLLFRNITLNQTASLIILAVGIFMFSLWWQRRQERAYGLFAIAAFVWSLQSINLFIVQVPVSTTTWEILVNASFQVFSTLLLVSMLSFVGILTPFFRSLLWGMMLMSPLTLVLIPPHHFFKLTTFWHLCSVLATGITLFLLVREALFRKNRDAGKLIMAMAIVLAFAAHDWAIHSHQPGLAWLKPLLQEDGYMLQFAAPVLFLMIGMIMTSRFARALNDYEQLNNELEYRVQEKHQQLELSYARMRELERQQAMREERERIYSDLHDDMGAKLLSLVYRAGSTETADLARSALQDLRSVVSQAETNPLDMPTTLLGWQGESRQRLQAAGVQLVWQQALDVETTPLEPAQVLHLERILRESLSNVIHHAQATEVQITLELDNTQLRLDIRDNGKGLADKQPLQGRGLKNIESRAQALGAALHYYPAKPQGFGLALTLKHALFRTG